MLPRRCPIALGKLLRLEPYARIIIGRSNELDTGFLEGALELHERLRAAGWNAIFLFETVDCWDAHATSTGYIFDGPA